MTRFAKLCAIVLLALAGPAGAARAQGAPQAAPPASAVPLEQALYLIRSTLLTLDDANRSGNYTVLRDLGSPDFQAGNTAADLSQHFADLRRRKFDLHPVAISAPQLTAPPRIEPNKMLRLTGYFPTKPLQINFDMLFQNVGGQWRLFGLSVATPQAQAPAQQPAAQQQQPAGAAGKPPAKPAPRR